MDVIRKNMNAKDLNRDILFDRNEQRRNIHVIDMLKNNI